MTKQKKNLVILVVQIAVIWFITGILIVIL